MKYLIAGLGNPGSQYRDTRHNIGFMVLDRLAERLKADFEPDRNADSAHGKFKGRQIHMIKPTTYMNLSGKAVRFHLQKHKIPNDHLLVVTDDLALPFGRLRLRGKGSDGGHNGLKDINALLNTQQYARLRFGVGNDFHKGQQVDYVLAPFSSEEFEAMPELIDKCVQGILNFATIGLGRTMSELNRK